MNRYEVVGSCLVDNETGHVRVEAVDTPRNRRKLVRLAEAFNKKEREYVQMDRFMRANRAAWI